MVGGRDWDFHPRLYTVRNIMNLLLMMAHCQKPMDVSRICAFLFLQTSTGFPLQRCSYPTVWLQLWPKKGAIGLGRGGRGRGDRKQLQWVQQRTDPSGAFRHSCNYRQNVRAGWWNTGMHWTSRNMHCTAVLTIQLQRFHDSTVPALTPTTT